jgi:DNA primase
MPYIKKAFAEDLLDKVDILDIVSDYTEVKKKGTHFFGLSPFQKEKTPSFWVDKVKQRFYCKSSDKSGNAITFLMEADNLSYPEAIETMAKKYGIPVAYEDAKFAEKRAKQIAKKDSLRPVLQSALLHYKNAFKELPEDHEGKKEVIGKRQYSDAIICDWGIGYAPGQRFISDKLVDAKLVEQGKEISLIGEKYDKYWQRIIYPIYDVKGLLIGFAGRDVSGNEKAAKWINPAESILYEKNKTWFALNRAAREIVNVGEANIVEGYNDVIAWHENGLINTIAPCGTSITDTQIKLLKKYTSKINFTFDDDKAGNKAMLRYIAIFLEHGFTVNIQRTAGLDPDDFVRAHFSRISFFQQSYENLKNTPWDNDYDEEKLSKLYDLPIDEIKSIAVSNATPEKYALEKTLEEIGDKVDGFAYLMKEYLKGNPVEKSKGAYKMCEIIAKIPDEALVAIYTPWVSKESKVSVTKIREWVKQAQAKFEAAAQEAKKKQQKNNDKIDYRQYEYTLPDQVTTKWEDVRDDVYKYGVFASDNRMWVKTGKEGEYTFKHITNCSIVIIQHMADEEFPMKLLRIKNIHGLEKIFDCPSESVDSQQRFTTALSNNGNFIYTGDSRDFLKLKVYLFEKMGVGRKIEVLGHQPEGFWVWNNLVQLYNNKTIEIDNNGIFVHDNISYYVPSANSIYRKNPFKYESQKRFKVQKAKVTFKTFASKAMEVHREFAISAILFGVASLFQDIVVKELENFPILFLYGPAGTGKDQISEMVQSFYGIPQQAQNLEGGASTMKAKIIKLAQFFNGVCEFSEYKRGDDKVDGILKGVWDRNGYERGNITSKIGLETVPILSSLILTGNDYPGQEALITRLFANEVNKNEFSEEESKRFDEFKDMCSDGYSSYSQDILNHRAMFQEQFMTKYRSFRNSFKEVVPDAIQRMISNASVLGATYSIFQNTLDFPFTFNEMETYFKNSINQQMRKLQSESIINKWWDCFLYGIKSPENIRLIYKEDFKIEGRSISFHFNQVYAKMAQLWPLINKYEAIPGKTFLIDKLKSSEGFVKYHTKGLKMDSGRDVKTSSGYEMDLHKTGVYDEIFDATAYQESKMQEKSGQANVFTSAPEEDELTYIPPATPTEKNIQKEESPENGEIINQIIKEENE